ncbi:6-methyl salicylic acid synthase [Xylariomycetidae sp. FL0641]|nr:6-methyl salicylic acid synthase [Xylariomycetidae sp. FL0641]
MIPRTEKTPSEPSSKVSGTSTPVLVDSSASELSDLGDTYHTNDVAVVGMACRVAGGNHSPEQLWESILAQRDASSEIPSWRWEPYERRDARNAAELRKTTKRGYFLDRVEDFDPAFFGVSPKEAEQMDPQQRLALEVAWEALEDAGIDPRSLSGSDTAVFMGVNSDDYSKLLLEDLPNVDAWMGIGTAYCGVPNRISYHLNLMGPSTAVDAACASSLVAIHHGHQAIMSGQSKVAITGGVNVLCGPGLTRVLDKAGAISPDGSCLSFDDNAHGYGRGEGAAVVVLKHLSSAIREGDNILAVLKGATVAQDGKTNGIMAPNAKAQELVARQALQQANVDPSTIEYVEAHATSTPLGDPTEVSAISAVYGHGTDRTKPVSIGSVKPNVGHLEAGAGAVGFIKAIMAMNHGQYPPQANLKKLNSKIDWEKSLARVVQEASEWSEPLQHPRRAAVCSYGYGGTVSHAIVEQSGFRVGQLQQGHSSESPMGPVLFVLSAPQEKRLAGQAKALADWLAGPVGKSENLTSIANTLALRRAQHDYRAAFVVESHEHAVEVLNAFAEGKSRKECTVQDVKLAANINKGVIWVFSGHGAQWRDMGKELLSTSPTFCQAIEPLDRIVQAENGFSAIEALESGDFVDMSDRVQVLTYVVQVGLSAVLRAKGLLPSAVIGHSVGEIAAAVAAGALTTEEGAMIVCRRANLYKTVQGQGGMLLVNLPFEQIKSELGEGGDLVAAIDSSPSSCVVSGKLDAVTAYAETMKSRGVKAMKVATDIAFHSHAMLDPLSTPLRKALVDAGIRPKKPTVPLYSTAEAESRYSGLRDADYWVKNMVNPVLLTSAVRAAVSDGYRLLLEVSSHPIVSHSVNETIMDVGIEDEEFSVLPTLRRNKSPDQCILQALGSVHVKGADVDFHQQFGRQWSPHVPGTQWVHKPIWRKVESGAPASAANLTHDVDKHTLLGLRNPVGGTNTVLYTTKLDDNCKPFPGSHPLHGTEIVPAAVLVNTFHHATQASTLSNITLRVPVAISAPRDVQVVVVDDTVKITSRLQSSVSEEDHSWVTHTTGRWNKAGSSAAGPRVDIEAAKKRINDVLPNNFSIDYLDKVGVSAMGFPWAVTEHYGNLKEMVARVDVAPHVASDAALPWDASSWASMLDAATSVGSTIFFDNPKLRMPAQIEKVHFYTEYNSPPPKTGYLYVEEASERNGAPAVHVSVCDDDGRVLAKFESMRFSEIEGTPGVSGSVESLVHKLAWVPAPLAGKAMKWEHAVLVSDDEAMLAQYSKQLSSKLRLGAEDIARLRSAADIASLSATLVPNTAIVYCPGHVSSLAEIPAKSEAFIGELLTLAKFASGPAASLSNVKVFALTCAVGAASTPTALAQAPLHGLGRIIASEHPDQWGALIDLDGADASFPTLALKYVQDQDVVRVDDDLPRVARLQPLPRESLYSAEAAGTRTLLPKPEGTYLITGGLGALGLQVAEWLAEKGARRLVLLSRRGLLPRREWASLGADNALQEAVGSIQKLERAGASVHAVALDIGAPDAAARLTEVLDRLALPPVLGVVHAAGALENELIAEATAGAFSRVLAPKVSGALALHEAFPVGALDWLVLFSSCGQLFGFPGQGSYGAGNAFLDAVAAHRRAAGDNAVAFQWTSWRGRGMASSTAFIDAELEGKGITDITAEEGFRAWEHLAKYDTDHGVVLRSRAFDAGEPLPSPLLEDIAVRKVAEGGASSAEGGAGSAETGAADSDSLPSGGPELKQRLDVVIRGVIAGVLMLGDAEEVDGRAAIADLGVDSVMTVTLRRKLQSALKVKVPPTLTWSHPTANHLVNWFVEKLTKA